MSKIRKAMKGKARLAVCLSLVLLTCVFLAVARAADDKCCNPAHAGDPSPPAGGNYDCFCSASTWCGYGEQFRCTGDAWETALAGVCQTSTEDDCTPNAGQTNVTIRKGYHECSEAGDCTPHPADNCDCLFKLPSEPDDDTLQVSTCSGDGC